MIADEFGFDVETIIEFAEEQTLNQNDTKMKIIKML